MCFISANCTGDVRPVITPQHQTARADKNPQTSQTTSPLLIRDQPSLFLQIFTAESRQKIAHMFHLTQADVFKLKMIYNQ